MFIVCPGRVFVYGGSDVNYNALASVEMLSDNGKTWQILYFSPMFLADTTFASVPLTVGPRDKTTTEKYKRIGNEYLLVH